MTTTPIEKFQSLLRDLFQFDCADLDFGIYRIMNRKRQVIERFIAQDLPKAIAEELKRGALAEQGQAQEALQTARQRVLDALGEDALDAAGNLAEKYRETKAGKEYLEAQAKAAGARSTEALEAAVYNHLYAFFSRYWQDGDFISKRRYSKKERYAIPYNGEEVTLYWANHDQYYIKTGEFFTDYTYKAPNGVSVHFKLQQADVEQNNVKGEKRFFLPVPDGITYSPLPAGEGTGVRGTLTIPFQFRPLTEQENIAYGQKNQQEAIIAKAVAEIPKRVKAAEPLAALTAERRAPTPDPSPKGRGEDSRPAITLLEHHLRQYTRRNTSDFFIHKDLKGFLSRELDFYLKNEVLNLEEMEAAGEQLAEGWFQLMRLIKRVGLAIIDFLAQIEDFQKMLWEKKKFVTETFYVVTVGNVPEAFYPEIAECEAQWKEWEGLGFSHGDTKAQRENLGVSVSVCESRTAFLKAHPTLPLDTRHFPPDPSAGSGQSFTDRLLAAFDPSTGSGQGLDEMTDGLLVHAENWQALNLLQEKYRERVEAVYIDPPYNSPTSRIIYKNDYEHSSWLTLMYNRLERASCLHRNTAGLAVAIDDNEYHRLRGVISNIYRGAIESVVVRSNPAGRSTPRGFSLNHEYALFAWMEAETEVSIGKLRHTHHQQSRYKESDSIGPFEWVNFRKHGGIREESPKMYYPIFINQKTKTFRIPQMFWDDSKAEWVVEERPQADELVVYPLDELGQARRWKWSVERLENSKEEVKVDVDRDG